MTYTVTFWGVRGSLPTPGPQTARFGGNTACVAVSGGPDQLVILDAGSGIRPLGRALESANRSRIAADILLSHTHWDHIQGLPFFQPLYRAGNTVRIYGPGQAGVKLKKILARQMDPVVFPVPLKALSAELSVTEITPDPFEVDGFRVDSVRLRHPGITLGYRLRPLGGGTSMAYVTDNELGSGGSYDVPADWRRQLAGFLSGVDTLIHDAMYSEELMSRRAGWGHSTPRQAVELAAECGVRRLVLFHHEPDHDDVVLDRLLAETRAEARTRAAGLEVEAAREGMQLHL